jgi:hypothetical protein
MQELVSGNSGARQILSKYSYTYVHIYTHGLSPIAAHKDKSFRVVKSSGSVFYFCF